MIKLKKKSTRIDSATTLLALGFLLSIGLFVGLMSFGLYQLEQTQNQVNAIVGQLNTKIELVTQMRNAARERTVGMYAMVSTKDPFEQDDLFLNFNINAARFARARIALLTMELTDTEVSFLAKQAKLSGITVPVQNQVIDLVQTDLILEAKAMLNSKAVPLQNQILTLLTELKEHQRQTAIETAEFTEQEQLYTKQFIYSLGGMGALLSIIIAIFVIRRTSRVERNLYVEKEQAELTLHSIGDAVITTDQYSKIKIMNPRAEEITGHQLAESIGKPLAEIFNIVDEYNRQPVPNPIIEALNTGKTIKSSQTELLINKQGFEYAIEHTIAPIFDIDNRKLGAIIIFRDETETRALSSQLSYQASHDMLTGLVNRREFEIRLEHSFSNVRADSTPYAMCYLDLDQFKLINDTCGHVAGDELLRQISQTLKQHVRKSDTLARLGGDEFGVLLEACSLERAGKIAQILLEAVNEFRFVWKGQTFDVGVSIGVAPITPMTASLSELFSAADSACYLAKDKGRNCVHIYHPNDREIERHRGEMQWVRRINDALDNDGFILYYQPIISLSNDVTRSTHYEILIRMTDSNNDIIPPMAFIPAAERYNLMPAIDKWVVHNAIKKITEIVQHPQYIGREGLFTINISGQSLSSAGFSEFVLEEINNAKLKPGVICLEITETAAITNMSSAIDFIKHLRLAGCRFALDDFGSGLSSFSYLKNMPVDYIKIDGSFVRDICDDKTDHAFVEAITQIGHVMNIQTIAEFVENHKILEELRTMGVDYAQGYHVAIPTAFNDFITDLTKSAVS